MNATRFFILIAAVCGLSSGVQAGSLPGDLLGEPHSIQTARGTVDLLAVPLPKLPDLEDSLQARLISSRTEVNKQFQSIQSQPVALANTIGLLGQLYHANHIYAPAEICYRNAEALDPSNFRWPHLLGYLSGQTAQHELAVRAFQRARAHNPEYEASRIRLAQTHIELNQHPAALLLLDEPFDDRGIEAAVQFSRGQIALSDQNYETAVTFFEQALARQPDASRIHYPLAMAHRGMGNIDTAKEQLAQYGDGKVHVTDPVVDGLNDLVTGNRIQLQRGLLAVQTGQHNVAISAFAGALAGDPENVNLRVSLARSLYLGGRREEGRQQLAEALKRDPSSPAANFFMGILSAADNDHEGAITFFEATIASDPEHAGARHFLADSLVRQGRHSEAVPHYRVAIRQVPKDIPARIMEAVSLLHSGAPHAEVVNRFETLQAEQSGQPVFSYLLARMLAASPDDKVRDGKRALSLAEPLYQQIPVAENAETLAMAYAETGRFEDAIGIQQEAIANALMAGRFDLLPRLQTDLDQYQQQKPCRIPFTREDPLLQPPPVDPALPFRDYPVSNPY